MERKKIIINEIKYWKKNRLLPEHYCNFLLTLYTEGEQQEEVSDKREKTPLNWFPLLITFLGLALFGLTFLVIYFTDFSSFLQTGLVLFFSIIMFFLANLVKRFDYRLVHLYILIGALMVFMATIHFTSYLFPDQPNAIIGAVIITCMIWFIIGKKYNLKYFLVSGILGIIVTVYFFFG